MTDFLVTPDTFDLDPVFLTNTVFLNLSITAPLLKAIGPGAEALAACEFLYKIHPEMYKEEHLTFELTAQEADHYRLLLRAIDNSLCEFRTLINNFLTFFDPTVAPYPILPLLAPLVGVDFNFDIPEDLARRELINAIFLWERKGTRANVINWIEFITGYRVRLREFYKEVVRTNVWGQAYHSSTVVTQEPVIWREGWDVFLPVPSMSLSRSLPPSIWAEDWERVVRGDPYSTLPQLNEHHRTNTWNGTEIVPPFYNYNFEADINYGTHGFTQNLPGYLLRNHLGIYLDIPESDLIDTVDTQHSLKPLTTDARINGIFIETGLRVIFTALEDAEIDDNELIWEADVSVEGEITWHLHTTLAAEIGSDFLWFGTPFLDIILRKIDRILDLVTLFGIVNHTFWRLVSRENAFLCHQYVYDIVPRFMEGWGENLGEDLELPPEIVRITQATNCNALDEETFSCYGDTYNIDIDSAFCCVDEDEDDACAGRLATFVLCTNTPDDLSNQALWLTYYPTKYWSHQVDDILQEWTPDTDGSLTAETTIPAEYTPAEIFINPLIGTGTGQGKEEPTSIAAFITATCFTGTFDRLILYEEWASPFVETSIITDTWDFTTVFAEDGVITDPWNLPAFDSTLVVTDNWDSTTLFDDNLVIFDDWDSTDSFTDNFIFYDDWEDNLPMLIPGDEIWLDGNNGPMAESPVITWLDRSGSNNDAAQATLAYRPDYIKPDPTYNNFGSVTFDGTNDYMIIPNNGLLNTDRFSLYLVGQWTDPGTLATFVSKIVNESMTTGGWGLTHFGSNKLRFFVDNINTHYLEYTLPNNTPFIVRCSYDQTTLQMSVNGVPIVTGSSLYGGGTINSSNELYVGAHLKNGVGGLPANGYLHGTIAEFIYYSHILTPPEELSLLLYLSAKYDIAVTTEFEQFSDEWNFDTAYSSNAQVNESFNFDILYTEVGEVAESFNVTLSYSATNEANEGWDTNGDLNVLFYEDWETAFPLEGLDPLMLVFGKFQRL